MEMEVHLWILWAFLILLGILALIILLARLLPTGKKPIDDWRGKNVFITGASQGLGKALAIKLSALGANITLISRSQEKLEKARKEVAKAGVSQKILCIPCDVTDYDQVEKAVQISETEVGPIDVLITCAGESRPRFLKDYAIEDMQKEMQLNYFGSVFPAKAVVSKMIQREKGNVVLVSSSVVFVGVPGFTNYAATKTALQGFANCLRSELLPFNIGVSIMFPGSMDTPGFEEEQKGKPEITKKIEASQNRVKSPDEIAQILIDSLKAGKFLITDDFMSNLARLLQNGLAPRSSLLFDFLFSSILVLVSPFILWNDFDSVVTSFHKQQKKMK